MAAIIRIQSNSILKRIQPVLINLRAISKSKNDKKSDDACKNETSTEKKPVNKNWVSYGFDSKDKSSDRQAMHLSFFGGITLSMIIGGFVWVYMPDAKERDWAQREAYLELRRRENLGLPHIDKNVIDPGKFTLPNDEELGEIEIII